MPKTPLRVAIYARVSTRNKQETENQLRKLREYCDQRDWKISDEYIDQESGGTPDRSGFQRLFEAAHQGAFDLVLFWALDRFSREGVLKTLNYLNELESAGVDFKSYTERYLDSSGIFKEAILALLATLAKQERVRISERVKAGMDRARAQGKRVSRPPIPEKTRKRIAQLANKNWSLRAIARELGISPSTVGKYRNL